MVKPSDLQKISFPFVLVRLPSVPRSVLHDLAYKRTIRLTEFECRDEMILRQAFEEDSKDADITTVSMLQRESFLTALEHANPQLAEKVRVLPLCPSEQMVKKQRQTVRTALRYFWRAALRPVPFGLLCGTGLGVVDHSLNEGLPKQDLRLQMVPSRRSEGQIASVIRKALCRPILARKSHLYLSPVCWIDDHSSLSIKLNDDGRCIAVPDRFHGLLKMLKLRGPVSWHELHGLGFSEEMLHEAVELEVVGQCVGDGDDKRISLLQLLWEAVPEDLTLLNVIDTISAGTDADRTGSRQGSLGDSCFPALVRLRSPGMNEFLSELSEFACAIGPTETLESKILTRLFERFSPSRKPIPIIEFYEKCAQLGQSYGIDSPGNLRAFAEVCGITTGDSSIDFCSNLLTSSAEWYKGSVQLEMPREWEKAELSSRRACVRFRRVSDRATGPRYQIVYFGSDRMSLLPRYARLPFDNGAEFVEATHRWLGSWLNHCELYGLQAHTADEHDPFTSRLIYCGGSPLPKSIRFADLKVVSTAPNSPPFLTDPSGVRVWPCFFGVAAQHTLPSFLSLALEIGNPERSILEVMCRAINFTVSHFLASLDNCVVTIPEFNLGKTIVLSPKLFLVPSVVLPRLITPVSQSDFRCFQRWLCEVGLPRGLVEVSIPMREPQWLDLGHPEGVNNLFRITRSNERVIIAGAYLDQDSDGLQATDGWYEPEYYAEVGYQRATNSVESH